MRASLSVTLVVTLLVSVLSPSMSLASNSTKKLIESCYELVGIYESKNKKALLAAQTTSLSEALRAGYCRGVIAEYKRQNVCRRTDWFDMAKFIAHQFSFESKFKSTSKLLRLACND